MLRAKTRFDDSFKRIRNQDSIYKHLVSTLHFPEKDISDMLRSEVVYAVSSFDRFIHDIVKQGMVDIFMGNRPITSAYSNFSISLNQLQAIRIAGSIPPPQSIFEDIIIEKHKHLSFQEPNKVSEALSLIWNENYKWQKIAICMGVTDNDLKTELKNIVIRRNQIVHEGDLNIMTGQLQDIYYSDTVISVDFIEKLGNCIFSLI
jgi:hypothetical protein